MSVTIVFAIAAVLVISILVTGLVRRFALSHGVMDIPNERSSHTAATPRGGGLSIVLACTACLVGFALLGVTSPRLVIALVGGGGAVAAIGFLDDRRPLPAALRFTVHVAAAIWAVGWLGGLPPLRIGDLVLSSGWLGGLLAVLAIVWTLNLFNFMDGIDGIAAAEAVFVTGSAVLLGQHAAPADVSPVAAIYCAGALGFLVWNWPPARIFMGDVGSGYLGFVIAVLALASTRGAPAALWVWLILGGSFFIDATVTLLRRSLRGERVHEAHRSHAYQWLARRWGKHLPVTLSVAAVNLLWLLPAASLAVAHPSQAAWITGAAYFPLIVVAILAGAGRQER